jgi:aminoglycoside phosphotransferase (APT) family kinase protein
VVREMTEVLHEDELPVSPALVRRLVDQQLPAYASLPLTPLAASGSSNALFRLGRHLLVRVPRQPGGSVTIEKEARWLPHVGPPLPVPVPEVVAVGEPAFGYPERWSVVRWIDGSTPAGATSGPRGAALAGDLAAVVTTLGALPVPDDALTDPSLRWYRGEPLSTFDRPARDGLEQCRTVPGLDLDLDAALAVWDAAVRLPGSSTVTVPRWHHADLVAENLLVRDGRLVAVLDFGGLAVGDPTVDLVVAWDVLDPRSRNVFRAAVDVDDETWLRGRAWALALAVMTFPYYWTTMPARCASRLAVARAVLADAADGTWRQRPGPA